MSVQTVEQAMSWLFRHTRPEEYLYAAEADLPEVVLFACDMFWMRPSDFIKRMRKLWEGAMRDPAPRSWRERRREAGWR